MNKDLKMKDLIERLRYLNSMACCREAADMLEAAVKPLAWDASDIKQPGWQHVAQAFLEGAREARNNPEAKDEDFRRSADGYSKRIFEEVDPESERQLREELWAQDTLNR